MHAFGHHRVAGRDVVGRDQHAFRVALDDADRRAPGPVVADHPDERAVRAPLDRQRVDRRIDVAGEFDRDAERHAGAQRIPVVGYFGLHEQRAALVVDPVVDGAHRAVEHLVGSCDRRRGELAADRHVGGQALRHVEVDLDQRTVVDGGDHRVGGDVVARLDRQDADDAGDRRRDRTAVEIELRVAQRQPALPTPSSASVTCTSVAVLAVRSDWTRSSLASASASAILARSRAISSTSESMQRDHRAGLDLRAGRDLDLRHPAGGVRLHGDRIVRPAGADRRKLVVDGGADHRRGDHRGLRTAVAPRFLGGAAFFRRNRGLGPFYAPACQDFGSARKELHPCGRGRDENDQRKK